MGTTYVIFDPLDFIARLVALIPKPRVNLARYHGVFARGGLPSNSRWRDQVTPGSRGNGAAVQTEHEEEGKAKRRGMSCTEGRPAQRLKRVFVIDSRRETCHRVERRRRLGYLGKIEFTDSIAGIESLSWKAGYCLLGVWNRVFGGYFRMLPVNIRRTVCERGKFDEITGSD